MSNMEKTKILQMVEDEIITVEEAIDLLEAIKDDYTDDRHIQREFDEKVRRFADNCESFAKDFGDKIEDAFKSAEPKFKKATKKIVSKTAEIVDDLSKSLYESLENLENMEKQQGEQNEETPVENEGSPEEKPADESDSDDNTPMPN